MTRTRSATPPAPRLAGRVAAVTGGARGIGRATAAALAREGCLVAIGDLDAGLARETAEEVGQGAVGLGLNVADRASYQRFLDEAASRHGPLDVLVNNAGIMHLGRLVDEDGTAMLRMFEVNVFGAAHGIRLALPGLLHRGRGHIVNVASSAGRTGYPGAASYCATKAALLILSEALRAELRGTRVAVSVILPGVVRTELAAGLARASGERWLEPEDVARAIVGVLVRPRFAVFVPRWLGALDALASALPRPWREALARGMNADRALADADPAARAAYERRAACSSPDRPPP